MLVTVVEHFMCVPSPDFASGARDRELSRRARSAAEDAAVHTGTEDEADWRAVPSDREYQILRSGSKTERSDSPPVPAAALDVAAASAQARVVVDSPVAVAHSEHQSNRGNVEMLCWQVVLQIYGSMRCCECAFRFKRTRTFKNNSDFSFSNVVDTRSQYPPEWYISRTTRKSASNGDQHNKDDDSDDEHDGAQYLHVVRGHVPRLLYHARNLAGTHVDQVGLLASPSPSCSMVHHT